jgi:hypothetical protein
MGSSAHTKCERVRPRGDLESRARESQRKISPHRAGLDSAPSYIPVRLVHNLARERGIIREGECLVEYGSTEPQSQPWFEVVSVRP